jgi:hypothetical protein
LKETWFNQGQADPPPQEVLPIDQRTDPVLVEFGIDMGSLHDERTINNDKPADSFAAADPARFDQHENETVSPRRNEWRPIHN